MYFKSGIKLHNRFDIEVRDSKTGDLKQKGIAENIVLNQMYTRICADAAYFVNIHFGNGTGTLDPTRTSLFNHLGTRTAETEETIKAFPVSKWVRKITLNPEEFVDTSFTEVGIAYGSTNTNLVTHALIKDSEGNPLSLTKTNLDVLVIYATVFIEFNEVSSMKWYTPAGSNKLVVYLTSGTATSPVYAQLHVDTIYQPALTTKYMTPTVSGNKRVFGTVRFGISEANSIVNQIKGFSLTQIAGFEMPAPDILGNWSLQDTTIGVGDGIKTNFVVPYGAVKNIIVKVNGVETSDYLYGGSLVPPPNNSDYSYPHTPIALELIGVLSIISINEAFLQVSKYGTQTMIVERLQSMAGFYVGIQRMSGNFNSDGASARMTVYGSNDQVTWEVVLSQFNSSSSYNSSPIKWATFAGTVDQYRYLKFVSFSTDYALSTYNFSHKSYVAVPTGGNLIKFATAPAQDAVVEVAGTLEYLPKNENYVLDVGFEIEYGEGV